MLTRRRWSAPVWVILMAILALPIPFRGVLLPERGTIIVYLLVAGALCLFLQIGRVSLALAWLLVYLLAHGLTGGFQVRELQLVLLMALAAVLYVEAVKLPEPWGRTVGWAFIASAALQGVLGVLNLFNAFPSILAPAEALRWFGADPRVVYRAFDVTSPWLTLYSRDYLHRSMGWLSHPNYWGAYLALVVPVAYTLCSRWIGGSVALGVCALSGSVWPVVSAAAGLLVVSWRDVGRKTRLAVLGGLLMASATVGWYHLLPRLGPDDRPFPRLETLTSGRTNVWRAAWPTFLKHPFWGNGFGSWRVWSIEYNHRVGAEYATQQAHDEPIQALFELGVLGLALGGWWALGIGRGGLSHLRAGDPIAVMWVSVLVVALVNCLGSPTFHLPTQAGVTLFAAARAQRRSA